MTHKRQGVDNGNNQVVNPIKRLTQNSLAIQILLVTAVVLPGGLMFVLESSQGWYKQPIPQLPVVFWILNVMLILCPAAVVALRWRAKTGQVAISIVLMLLLLAGVIAFSGSQSRENGRDLVSLWERWFLLVFGIHLFVLPYLFSYTTRNDANRQKRR